jgi:hypothetical protein
LSSAWSMWLGALPPFAGLMAAGVRSAAQTTDSKVWTEGFSESALANAWRCVDDTFRVMRLHQFPTQQLRWTYDQAVLTAVRRADGCLLLVLTQVEQPQEAKAALNSWIKAFLSGSQQIKERTRTSTSAGARAPAQNGNPGLPSV